jgi:hypothetical protein
MSGTHPKAAGALLCFAPVIPGMKKACLGCSGLAWTTRRPALPVPPGYEPQGGSWSDSKPAGNLDPRVANRRPKRPRDRCGLASRWPGLSRC